MLAARLSYHYCTPIEKGTTASLPKMRETRLCLRFVPAESRPDWETHDSFVSRSLVHAFLHQPAIYQRKNTQLNRDKG